MYGYEYELQRQRSQRIQTEAEMQRIISQSNSPTAYFRRTLGQKLVKLGAYLQGDTQSIHTDITT